MTLEGPDDIDLVPAWPKVCGCGLSYDAHTWRCLAYAGEMVDDVESLELRNCSCGSTIAQTIEVGSHLAHAPKLET